MGIKYCSEHGKISICTDNECNNTQPNPTQPNTTQTSHLTIRTAAQPRSHRAYKVQRRQDPILTSTYAAPRNSRIRVPNGSPYNNSSLQFNSNDFISVLSLFCHLPLEMFPGSLINSSLQNSNIFLSYPHNAISTRFQYQIKPIHPYPLIPGHVQCHAKPPKKKKKKGKKDIKDLHLVPMYSISLFSHPFPFLAL
ncbi:hypothetical protein EYC84_004811 [Monilinia fructicola]|uniref:Uncharacterized protein n=1 Tax=Monilinia fructicola TaxID=38448 RepID=A0A5M9K4F4_MONFR|nr:hypothetical protein EYC84_004811 [Monilinia fructicola]